MSASRAIRAGRALMPMITFTQVPSGTGLPSTSTGSNLILVARGRCW